jgi:putative flippase GtrA
MTTEITVKASVCNALAGTQARARATDSRQATEKNEVAPSRQGEDWPESAESQRASSSNSSISSEMRSCAMEIPSSISCNPYGFSELRRGTRAGNAKNIHQKHASTNAGGRFLRWWRFNLVGAIGIVVQLVALFLLKSIFHFHYLAATALAVEAAVVHNFVWHEQFTWADRVEPAWRTSLPRFACFQLTAGGVSLASNLAMMKAMVGFGHLNYLAANAIAIGLCSVVNFLVSDGWVFER